MIRVALALALWLAWSAPAHAFFLAPAAIASALSVSLVTATVISAAASVALSLGVSWAANKFFGPKQDQSQAQQEPGGVQLDLRIDADVPQQLIVGTAVTAGSRIYAETYGTRGDIDNSDLVEITVVADHPITAIRQTYIESQEVDLTTLTGGEGTVGVEAADRGLGVSAYDFKVAFAHHFGDQTDADAFAVAALSGHSERPWTSEMVVRSTSYVRTHTVYDREKMAGPLPVRWVVDGIALYDPRFDSTVGGSGSQRFDDLDTHEFTANLAVIAYNILRGIRVKDHEGTPQHFYGLEGTSAENLPLDNWFAAMNECDVDVDGEPQYHGGAEISVDTEPLEAIRQILKACDGRLSELGGVYKLRLGAPGLPVLSFDDGALRADEGDTFRPITPLERRVNCVTAKYTAPEDGWVPKVAAPRLDPEAEAEDGRRLSADLDVPMVQSAAHVQRLQKQMLLRNRRARRHVIPLPPAAFGLEPGDIVEWNSERNGYIEKLFEVEHVELHANLNSTVTLLEVDPDDYDWDGENDYIPQPVGSLVTNRPAPKVIEGFDAQPYTDEGTTGIKRAAILVTWQAPTDGDIDGVQVQYRRPEYIDDIATASTDEPDAERMILRGSVVPATDYEVRAHFSSYNGYEREWSLWIPVTTHDVRVLQEELSAELDSRVRQVVEQFNELSAKVRRIGDNLSAAVNSQVSALRETHGRTVISVGETYGENKAAIEQVAIAYADADEALAALITAVEVEVNDNTAAITNEMIVRATADEAIAANLTTLETVVNGNTASISQEVITRSTADEALASDITDLTATVGSNTAAITNESIARATADSALSGRLTSLFATGPGGSAETMFRMIAATDAEGALATIALQARAGPAESYTDAGLYIDVMPGFGRIRTLADYHAVQAPGVNGGDPFYLMEISGDVIRMHALVEVQTLKADTVDTEHLKVGSVDINALISGAAGERYHKATNAMTTSSNGQNVVTHNVSIADGTRRVQANLDLGNVSSLGGTIGSGGPGSFYFKFKLDGSTLRTIKYTHNAGTGNDFNGLWMFDQPIQYIYEYPAMSAGTHEFKVELDASGTTTTLTAGDFTISEVRR